VSAPALAGPRPTLRVSPATIASLSAAAVAWAAVIVVARHMGNGVGTMQLSLPEFTGMWALMMAAMMLPAVAPVASLYLRTISTRRPARWLLFVAGYFLVWSALALPAYLILRGFDTIASDTVLRIIAAAVLAGAGVYQLTPLKAACLRHCRSPLGQLLQYGNVTGTGKELRVAAHHAAYCIGCCWALTAIMLAFGVMNVWAMLILAAVLVGEKLLARGEALGRFAGIAFIAVAVALVVSPRVAHEVLPTTNARMAPGMTGM
jgi:predicted metal-binding membrane protein